MLDISTEKTWKKIKTLAAKQRNSAVFITNKWHTSHWKITLLEIHCYVNQFFSLLTLSTKLQHYLGLLLVGKLETYQQNKIYNNNVSKPNDYVNVYGFKES